MLANSGYSPNGLKCPLAPLTDGFMLSKRSSSGTRGRVAGPQGPTPINRLARSRSGRARRSTRGGEAGPSVLGPDAGEGVTRRGGVMRRSVEAAVGRAVGPLAVGAGGGAREAVRFEDGRPSGAAGYWIRLIVAQPLSLGALHPSGHRSTGGIHFLFVSRNARTTEPRTAVTNAPIAKPSKGEPPLAENVRPTRIPITSDASITGSTRGSPGMRRRS